MCVCEDEGGCLTVYRREDDPRVVVGDDVCIAVLWLVYLQVRVFPGKLLARVDGLRDREREREREKERQYEMHIFSTCNDDDREVSPLEINRGIFNLFISF